MLGGLLIIMKDFIFIFASRYSHICHKKKNRHTWIIVLFLSGFSLKRQIHSSCQQFRNRLLSTVETKSGESSRENAGGLSKDHHQGPEGAKKSCSCQSLESAWMKSVAWTGWLIPWMGTWPISSSLFGGDPWDSIPKFQPLYSAHSNTANATGIQRVRSPSMSPTRFSNAKTQNKGGKDGEWIKFSKSKITNLFYSQINFSSVSSKISSQIKFIYTT